MKTLILTSFFFAIGFTSYSQNDKSLVQEETKKIIILKNVNNKNTVTINKTSVTTEVILK